MTAEELEKAIARVNHPSGVAHFAAYVEYATNDIRAMLRAERSVPDWFTGAVVMYAREWSHYQVRLCRRDGGIEEYKFVGRRVATEFLADHARNPLYSANAIRRLENG